MNHEIPTTVADQLRDAATVRMQQNVSPETAKKMNGLVSELRVAAELEREAARAVQSFLENLEASEAEAVIGYYLATKQWPARAPGYALLSWLQRRCPDESVSLECVECGKSIELVVSSGKAGRDWYRFSSPTCSACRRVQSERCYGRSVAVEPVEAKTEIGFHVAMRDRSVSAG